MGVFVDRGEFKRAVGVIRRLNPKRIDVMFSAEGKTVGIESKKPDDLTSSVRSHRLARQLRTLLGAVDVPCLMLRGGWPALDWKWEVPLDVYVVLVSAQMMGIVVLPGPVDDADLVPWLEAYRPVLLGKARVKIALAGSDKKRPPGLLRAIPGVGVKQEEKLLAAFGSVKEALFADDEEWKRVGVGRAIIANRARAFG